MNIPTPLIIWGICIIVNNTVLAWVFLRCWKRNKPPKFKIPNASVLIITLLAPVMTILGIVLYIKDLITKNDSGKKALY